MSRAHNMMPKIDGDKLLEELYGDWGKEQNEKHRLEKIERERHEFDGTEYEGMCWKEVQLRKEIACYEHDKNKRQSVIDNASYPDFDPMIQCENGMIDLDKKILRIYEERRKYCEENGLDYFTVYQPIK